MQWVLFCIVIIIVLVMIITIIDMKRIKTVKYMVTSEKIKKETRIVFLSDLHSNMFGLGNHRLLEKIDELKPDYVFIGGDMIVANGTSDFKVAEELISSLTSNYKVFYALGNHEYRVQIYKEKYKDAYADYINSIKSDKLVMLDNHTISLEEERIKISGLTLNREFYHRIKKISSENMELKSSIGTVDSD